MFSVWRTQPLELIELVEGYKDANMLDMLYEHCHIVVSKVTFEKYMSNTAFLMKEISEMNKVERRLRDQLTLVPSLKEAQLVKYYNNTLEFLGIKKREIVKYINIDGFYRIYTKQNDNSEIMTIGRVLIKINTSLGFMGFYGQAKFNNKHKKFDGMLIPKQKYLMLASIDNDINLFGSVENIANSYREPLIGNFLVEIPEEDYRKDIKLGFILARTTTMGSISADEEAKIFEKLKSAFD